MRRCSVSSSAAKGYDEHTVRVLGVAVIKNIRVGKQLAPAKILAATVRPARTHNATFATAAVSDPQCERSQGTGVGRREDGGCGAGEEEEEGGDTHMCGEGGKRDAQG